jgi:hypothetical protein
MSDPTAKTVTRVLPDGVAKVSVGQIFLEFLDIGITSFGGVERNEGCEAITQVLAGGTKPCLPKKVLPIVLHS